MYNNIATIAEGIIKKKVEIRDLKRELAEEEDTLVSQLAQENPSMLQVNWARVCRCYEITPVKYR